MNMENQLTKTPENLPESCCRKRENSWKNR